MLTCDAGGVYGGGLVVIPVKWEFSSPPRKRGLVDRRSFGCIAVGVALAGDIASGRRVTDAARSGSSEE